MASIPVPIRIAEAVPARPLNILRDLPAVADLIELCFSSSMDNDGQIYVQQMRRASRDASFLRWARTASETASLPLSGYVWEENGKIVGNASLVPFRCKGQRIYLIANVATHPDFRRRGIARALTERAMLHARARGGDAIWLHVREDNPAAVKMYTDLGFVEHARRTTWQAAPDPLLSRSIYGITITTRHARYWPQQRDWLRRLHPDGLAWYRAWNWSAFEPGLWNWFYRTFVEFDLRQWAALKGDELQAVLAWQSSSHFSDMLWAAVKPEADAAALESLLRTARRELTHRRVLTMEYPAKEAVEPIRSAGFTPLRTLIWMNAPGATS